MSRKYVTAVALLAVLALAFGVFGTVAPPLAEESAPVQPQQESSSESVGHFQNPPTYDSDWVNGTKNRWGQNFVLTHGLNTTEVTIYITGRRFGLFAPAWNRTYGGTDHEVAYSVVQTSDGGYAIGGYTYPYYFGSCDFWLVKTDATGNHMWNQTHGGTGTDYAYSVIQTSDGGYALAGYTNSYGAGIYDFWLVKTDTVGTLQWNKTYGGTNFDECYSVVQTLDGGYALVGETNSYGAGSRDFWLVKTDADGTRQWNKTYGGTSADVAHSLVQTSDGGYALLGYTNSYDVGTPTNPNFWLVKTDSAGTMLWSKTYGGTSSDYAWSVIQTSDGGYAIAGYTSSYGAGYEDFWLVKTDAAGNALWNQTYGGTSDDRGYRVAQTSDGGYALAGYTSSFSGSSGGLLVKTDAAGTLQWKKAYGGNSDATSVIQTGDGGYVLVGTNQVALPLGDFYLVKWTPPETREHQRNFGTEAGLAIIELTNNTITLYRGLTDDYWDYVRVRMWLIKEPSWIYGDINMDGIVDSKDLYIVGRNYGKTFSLLSLGGIAAIAGIRTVRKRKQKQPN